MKKHLLSLIAMSCLLASSTFAAEMQKPIPQWEIGGGTNAGFEIGKSNADGATSTDTLKANVTGGYFFNANWEGQADLGYTHVSNDGGHAMTLLVGPTYNFCTNPDDSFYLGALVGITSSNLGAGSFDAESRFTWGAHVGKRIPLVDHVQWSPELEYIRTGNKTDDVGLTSYGDSSWNLKVVNFVFSF